MRTRLTAFVIFLLLACPGFSQDSSKYTISLRNGHFIPPRNLNAAEVNSFNQQTAKAGIPTFLLIQFEEMPDAGARSALKEAGIELLEYIPANTYTATVRNGLSQVLLETLKVRSIITLSSSQKMPLTLLERSRQSAAGRSSGMAEVWVSYPRSVNYEAVVSQLLSRGMQLLPMPYDGYHIIALRLPAGQLEELASLPFIEYVQPAPGPDRLLNNKSRTLARANVLQSSLPGGRALRGEAVVMGVGDDSNPLRHVDFTNRLINRAAIAGGSHGLHVTGIMGGAGIKEEKYAGFAPRATIISQSFSNILAYAPAYIQDYGMVLTNNSYGNIVDDCLSFGVYDYYSRILDEMALVYPHLQNVFAAGNSGNYVCAPYPAGFHNVLGGYQSAKNVISVGNLNELSVLVNGSSRGPVADGRIKPEVTTQGTSVYSTYPIDIYGSNSGTSMASPAVTGGLALLYQRYRQLHGNADPMTGLMKALLCNGATDIGNPGPDYRYGFGRMNLLRSVMMLEHDNYVEASVNAGATNTHAITIPAGADIARLKVMLYWNDAPAAILASQTLVNDLDLEVEDPALTTHFPFLLDTLPANVNNNAVAGADHFNNIEQVVIENPGAGTYTFRVKGTTIPLSSQYDYFLVYDTIPVSVTIVYPVGGEHFAAGDSLYINWDAYGNPASDFSLQYSTDGGLTWPVTIATGVAAADRQYKWFVPAGTTGQGRVRLVQNGTGIESVSSDFSVIDVPVISAASVQCEGYFAVNWTPVADATDYELMMLRGDEMVPVGTVASTSYAFSGLSRDSVYWVSVRARINGVPGRRATAISRQPNSGTCAGSVSNNDLKLDAILSPAASGRKFTSGELSSSASISIRIRNLDDAPTSGDIPVRYQIGSAPAVNETILSPVIAAGATYIYTFSTTADLSAVGTYPLTVSVSYPADPVPANDTISYSFKQMDNPAIDLSTDFVDNFDAADILSYTSRQTGLPGLDRYDFTGSTVYGRIRTFVNSGIAYSGNRALTLDADRYVAAGNTDSLTATFNLENYDASADDIRLDFRFRQHGQLTNAANKVWVRGSDLSPWIPAYDLFLNQAVAGSYKQSSSIELRTLLLSNGQNYSPSLQVRWGQWGQILAADQLSGAGYTFDDIHLYKVTDDIQLVSIDTPSTSGCGLNGAVPVSISVRNSAAGTISSIPVKLQVDGGAITTETISAITGNTTAVYTFTATADLMTPGNHQVKVWVDLVSDSYRNNDTAMISLINSPLVSSFPYLQNFEADQGYWYANGTNSSWEYGTPSSTHIDKAASGVKAWKTNLSGSHNDAELSYLYSPCFDISGLATPMLSFSLALDLEDCGSSLCDGAYMEYSVDGKAWTRLGAVGAGTNWYNKNYSGNHLWSVQSYTRWHVASVPLPAGLTRLRLRFVMKADPYLSREGIAVDDIHIYDKQYEIYTGASPASNVVTIPAVNGSNWIDFTDGGGLVASVNPAGQNMGSTDVQAFIYTGAVRNKNGQYYHNRNITIKPTQTSLADSVLVRFYFTDAETELLLNATGCTLCSKPESAYELGVTKYSNTNKSVENDNLEDNTGGAGVWRFISNAVKVPYDKGYYAEFRVRDFSEFWLNNGGPDNNQALPVELLSFTAKREGEEDVRLDWSTASEINSSHYVVEMAKGNTALNQQLFTAIGHVNSLNSAAGGSYSFLDRETNKSGVRYYRIKMVDMNGHFSYSPVKPVVFDEEISWQVYPNPSKTVFNLVCQANVGELIDLRLHDMHGRLVRQWQQQANGFVQKIEINLDDKFSAGIYLLEAGSGQAKKTFRLVKL